MKKVLTAAVFFLLCYVFFTSLFQIGESFPMTVVIEMNLEKEQDIQLGFHTGGEETVLSPNRTERGTGGDCSFTFHIPSGSDGLYSLYLGQNTGKVRIGGLRFETFFRNRTLEYRETASYLVGYSGMVAANGFLTLENVPAGTVLRCSDPINQFPVNTGRLVLLLIVSVGLAAAFTVVVRRILSGKLGYAGLFFGFLAAAAMAFFVFVSLRAGFPELIFDRESVKKSENFPTSATEDETEATTEAPYDETVPQPLKNSDKPDFTAEWNTPKTPLETLTEGALYEGVLVGKTDETDAMWLYWNEELEDYRGLNLFTGTQLRRGAENLEAYRSWLKDNGIELYVVLCPNKSTVYPEYLPDETFHGEQCRYDQFLAYCRETVPEVRIIDVRESVLAAKDTNFPVYYRLDTHWNNYGGFAAYRQIMETISEDFPSVKIRGEEDYRIDLFDSYMKDEAWYLGYYDTFSEAGPVFTPLEKTGTELVRIETPARCGIFSHAYTQKNGYHDYNTYSVFENSTLAKAPSLYMLRDSFGISLSQFMKDSFSRSVFKWSSMYETADILNQKPDIVILEVVERELDSLVRQNFST